MKANEVGRRVPSRSRHLDTRHRRLHLLIWGEEDAPTLFFLHGWGDVAASFQFVVDHLRRGWRVVAPDARGFGLSTWNRDAYWFPDYLADLEAILDAEAGDGPARIVAHSMGGNVASLYAGIRPERVAELVNLEGFGLRPTRAEDAPERYRKWLDQIRAGSRYRHYADRDAFAARLRQENPRLTGERAVFLAEHMAQPGGEGLVPAADPCHRWVNPVLYRLEEAMACWRQATARVLWVRGDDSFVTRDFAGREEDYRRRLACFAGAREIVVPECGHNLHHDRPEVVARIIEEFFA
ncbi:MAG TPA: alpha/beta hydrolase [Rhodocyclaceae bacterium]|nr:alpha/beta hydrolase [Rhodocyclaceae bacterium]